MEKIITKIAIAAVILLALMLIFSNNKLKKENTRLLSNQEILLTQKENATAKSQNYKVSDSLNATKISELQFTLKEYKKYRTQDIQLIEQLKIKKSNLQGVINSQIETISSISSKLKDSIRIDTVDNIIDTLKYFNYKSKWTDVSGHIKRDSVDLQIKNRESLKIVETIIYKRFLGFLWKTNKIKDRQIDAVSENPNTKIVNLDYIKIVR